MLLWHMPIKILHPGAMNITIYVEAPVLIVVMHLVCLLNGQDWVAQNTGYI